MALGILQGCATEAPRIMTMRPPADGFCDLSDEAMLKYVVVVNANGRSNGTGFATIIGGRYMGEEKAEEFGARNGVEGELVVRLCVDLLIGREDVTG